MIGQAEECISIVQEVARGWPGCRWSSRNGEWLRLGGTGEEMDMEGRGLEAMEGRGMKAMEGRIWEVTAGRMEELEASEGRGGG